MTRITFAYSIPRRITVTMTQLRKTLGEVRDQLLSHEINGGGKKLSMETVCDVRTRGRCGTAACIGGWTSIFLLGFEGKSSDEDNIVAGLFSHLIDLDNLRNGRGFLHELFYDFGHTSYFDEPNVAATAIQRYLSGKHPWPRGDMPGVLPYTKPARKRAAKRPTKK